MVSGTGSTYRCDVVTEACPATACIVNASAPAAPRSVRAVCRVEYSTASQGNSISSRRSLNWLDTVCRERRGVPKVLVDALAEAHKDVVRLRNPLLLFQYRTCLSGQWNATLGFPGFATVNVDIRVTVIQEYAVPRKGTTLADRKPVFTRKRAIVLHSSGNPPMNSSLNAPVRTNLR